MSARRWPRAHHPPRRWLCRCPPGHAVLPAHIPKSAHRRAQPGGGNGHFYPAKQGNLSTVFRQAQRGHRASLGKGFQNQYPRHNRMAGEMSLEKRLCAGHALDSARPLAGGIVKNLIHQSKRVTVRQDLFRFPPPSGSGAVHWVYSSSSSLPTLEHHTGVVAAEAQAVAHGIIHL